MAITKVTRNLLSTGIDDQSNATAITIDSSENVGIGTTSPSNSLHIASADATVAHFQHTDGINSNISISDTSDIFYLVSRDGIGSIGGVNSSSNSNLNIDLTSGNVGIGTTSPSAPLHVSGSDSTVPIKIDNTGTGGDTWRIWSTNDASSDGGGKLGFYNEDTATRAMTLDSSGNVGIGTSTPATTLDITTSGGGKFQVTDWGASAQIGVDTTGKALRINGTSSLRLYTGTAGSQAEAMRIDSSGNVGIGETDPSGYWNQADNLVVGGSGNDGITIKSTSVGNGRLVFTDTKSTTAGLNDGGMLHYDHTSNSMRLNVNGSERMRIDSSGNVGIGTSSISYPFVVSDGGNLGFEFSPNDQNTGVNRIYSYDRGTSAYKDFKLSASQIIFGYGSSGGNEAMRIDSSGLVIVKNESAPTLRIENTDTSLTTNQTIGDIDFYQNDPSATGVGVVSKIRSINTSGFQGEAGLAFHTGTTGGLAERIRIRESGDLLVGQTSGASTDTGHIFNPVGLAFHVRDGGVTLVVDRLTNDGDLINLRKDGTIVGNIGVESGLYPYIGGNAGGSGDVFLVFISNTSQSIRPATASGASRDNAIDLGSSSDRFDDIYATNGTIQTSDRNEKQDIEALTDAETRVAVAAKGLLRKFRWQSAVEEKGDEARTHFGIIAQDLQDAFTAEGLDASDYAMFISTTWWETQTEVAAVEAVEEVTDEEGNVITEAVEAKDAYTRIDTYNTAEEAPEGATEKTRLGVRYSELLAFIIAAI